jgi:hypothetical protein
VSHGLVVHLAGSRAARPDELRRDAPDTAEVSGEDRPDRSDGSEVSLSGSPVQPQAGPDLGPDLVAALDTLQVPRDYGRDRARRALAAAGVPASTAAVAAAVRARKNSAQPAGLNGSTP